MAKNNLTVLKSETTNILANINIFTDKLSSNFPFWTEKQKNEKVCRSIPLKEIKGKNLGLLDDKKFVEIYFQPTFPKLGSQIESFFNWIEKKQILKREVKVRSTTGLSI